MVSNRHSSVDLSQTFDVLVVGGGNAALCAAITAREAGGAVLMLESAPKEFRGGNSLLGRRVLGGSFAGHRRADERVPCPVYDSAIERYWVMDGTPRLRVSAGVAGYPPSGENKCLLSRRG